MLRISMSVSLARLEKSPKPATVPLQPDLAHRLCRHDGVVGDVVDLECAGIRVAHQHVGLAEPGREIADARNRPFRPDLPEGDIAGDVVVAHVVERERPGRRIAHQQVGGVGTVKAANTRDLQRRVDLAERAVEQDLVLPDVVELVGPIGIAQHHQRVFGAGRRRRIGWRRHREAARNCPTGCRRWRAPSSCRCHSRWRRSVGPAAPPSRAPTG